MPLLTVNESHRPEFIELKKWLKDRKFEDTGLVPACFPGESRVEGGYGVGGGRGGSCSGSVISRSTSIAVFGLRRLSLVNVSAGMNYIVSKRQDI